MPYTCYVSRCRSRSDHKGIKFHQFPRDKTMENRWIAAIGRGTTPTKYSKVCSLHFEEDLYTVTSMGMWKTLDYKRAIPTLKLAAPRRLQPYQPHVPLEPYRRRVAFEPYRPLVVPTPKPTPTSRRQNPTDGKRNIIPGRFHTVFVISAQATVSGVKHSCAQCSFQSEWMFQIDSHVRKSHERSCKQFACLHEVYEHSEHTPKKYKCSWCGFQANCGLTLAKHSCCSAVSIEAVYLPAASGIGEAADESSDKCSYGTKRVWFKCPQCSYKAQRWGFLRRHISLLHTCDHTYSLVATI